jgi:hypothetical protein
MVGNHASKHLKVIIVIKKSEMISGLATRLQLYFKSLC